MNPYAAPQSTPSDVDFLPTLTLYGMAALAGIGTVGGAVLGTLTNMVNGAISPRYFRDVMRWESVDNIWLAAVAQGTLEGAVRGLVYGLLFVVLICIACRRRAKLRVVIYHGLGALGLALAFWLLGGVVAVSVAYLRPDWCSPRYFGPFIEWSLRACYAWVRGSIWGIVYGGALAALVMCFVYARRERRRL